MQFVLVQNLYNLNEYIMNPSSKQFFCLILNHYVMPIKSVYILTILDQAGRQPLWSSPVSRVVVVAAIL